MEETLDLVCASCSGITRKPFDWLQQHSECRCDKCGVTIAIGTNKQCPPRRRLP